MRGAGFSVEMREDIPLREVVFHTLQHAILRGEMKPGERLLEIPLAAKLGVSRTPVREAIRKLEQEGLVRMIPRKGAEVAGITEKDMRDVLEIRRALEELAVKLACEHITEEDKQTLCAAQDKFAQALKSGDVMKIAGMDVEFHDVIYHAAGNRKLIRLLNNIREQMYRYRMEYLKEEATYPGLLKEHYELVEAVCSRQKERAAGIISRHIEKQVDFVSEGIRRNNEKSETEAE